MSGRRFTIVGLLAAAFATGAVVRKPNLRNGEGSHQIGRFRLSGSVDTDPGGLAQRLADSPDVLAEAIVLNYLSLHGLEGSYESVMNGSPSLSGNLDEVIAFEAIRNL